MDDVHGNKLLTLDPNVTGVFNGPYPLGIDPVSSDTKSKWNSPGFTVNCAPPGVTGAHVKSILKLFSHLNLIEHPFVPVQVVNVSLWVINTIRNWLKAQNLTKVLVSSSVYSCRDTNMKEINIFSVLYLLCTSGIFSIYLDCWYILTSHLIGCTFPEPVGSHFSPRLHDTYHTAAMHISAWNLFFSNIDWNLVTAEAISVQGPM